MEYDLDIPAPDPATRDGSFQVRIMRLPPGGSFFAADKTSRDAHATVFYLRRIGAVSFYIQTQTRTEGGAYGIRIWRRETKVRG